MARSARGRVVADLLVFLEKTVRAVKIYPPGNPHCREFLDRLHDLFAAALAEDSPLVLRVGRFDLTHEEEVVYENDDRRESLAFLLSKDGLRELGFHRGLDRRELLDLVQAFNRDFTVDYLDDDVVTYLWERDLPHVTCHVSEEYLDDSLPDGLLDEGGGAPGTTGEPVRRLLHVEPFLPEQLRERILGGPAPRGDAHAAIPLRLPLLSPAQIALDPDEMVRLRQLQSRDEVHVFYEEMLEVIFSIFSRTEGEEQVRTYLALFRTFLESFFAEGALERAITLLRRLRLHAAGTSPTARQLEAFLAEIGSGDLLVTLGRSLESGAVEEEEALPELLALFPVTAVPGLVALLGSLGSMKRRKLVCQALARVAARDLALLAPGLQDRRWFVVRNLAYTLGMIGGDAVIPPLRRLLAHGDLRVRKEALRSLARGGEPEARRALAQAFSHADEATRAAALRILPRHPDPLIAAELARIVDDQAFAARSDAERAACARALGSLSGDERVPSWEERLAGGGWLRGRRARERKHAAVLALVARGSDAARAALARSLALLEPGDRRIAEAFLASPPPAAGTDQQP